MRRHDRPSSNTKQMPQKRLGIFVRTPGREDVDRLEIPLETASDLYSAFVDDLAARIAPVYRPTLFVDDTVSSRSARFDPKWAVVPQVEGSLGHRLAVAFEHLLRNPGDRAVIIKTDSPDFPLAHLKRAFQRLKHRDVVLGPTMDDGYYLVGLSRPAPSLFANIAWGTPQVFAQTLDAIEREGLSLALVDPWYDVHDAASLRVFASLQRARAIAGAKLFPHSARARTGD
jgi:uncharacterized protein